MLHRRSIRVAALLALSCWGAFACSRGNTVHDDDVGCVDADCATDSGAVDKGKIGAFELRAEYAAGYVAECKRAVGAIDVNLGSSAEDTVRALHCQVFGTEPDAELSREWSRALRENGYTRRIDVAHSFCDVAQRVCTFRYSDPWEAQEELDEGCTRKTTRDLGAVFMFFSDCPGNVNCAVDWSNTHTLGFSSAHLLYGAEPGEAGHYNPKNKGFWRRELLDARWAGLQFLALNVYGPDITVSTETLVHLAESLDEVSDIQIALFDDTWIWGRGQPVGNLAGIWGGTVGAPWTSVPDFDDPIGAAKILYESKWQPFFAGVPRERWYVHDGKPLVYFYNAGTFSNKAGNAAQVLAEMKRLFLEDFGVEPFLAVDTAFFVDDQNSAADARFRWNSGVCPAAFENVFHCRQASSYEMSGVRLDHGMVRWDSLNRDNSQRNRIATETDRIYKGPEALEEYLQATADADIAVLATWNDLGEGTGVNRNYDYYHRGEWLKPNAFMSLIRQAQCSN